MRRCGVALLLGALLMISGCGGGSDRPSADDVSQALRRSGDDSLLGAAGKNVSKKTADCLAKVLVGSKVSDTTLKRIVAADKNYTPSKADESALSEVAPDLVRCVQKQ